MKSEVTFFSNLMGNPGTKAILKLIEKSSKYQ